MKIRRTWYEAQWFQAASNRTHTVSSPAVRTRILRRAHLAAKIWGSGNSAEPWGIAFSYCRGLTMNNLVITTGPAASRMDLSPTEAHVSRSSQLGEELTCGARHGHAMIDNNRMTSNWGCWLCWLVIHPRFGDNDTTLPTA